MSRLKINLEKLTEENKKLNERNAELYLLFFFILYSS